MTDDTVRTPAVVRLLQMCDSLFPIGAFAHSDGLESAVAASLVTTVEDIGRWLQVGGLETFRRCDGPAVAGAWRAADQSDERALIVLDEDVTALRASAAGRHAGRAMGRRLLQTWRRLHGDARLERIEWLARSGALGPMLPVAFGAAAACGGIAIDDALAGYAYTRLAGIVSAAMRLVAIGQSDAHTLLADALERVPSIVDRLVVSNASPASFAPALDIAQMTQQYVHSRLFRS